MWMIFPAINFCNQTTKHEGQKVMKGNNVIDIIERFQTHHALREEREMKNFHTSTNGALAPDVPDKNGGPEKSTPETEEAVIADQPSLSQ